MNTPCPDVFKQDAEAHRVQQVLSAHLGAHTLGVLLRERLDAAIDSANTGRYCVESLEKSEKTAIGTQVEIALRDASGLPKGSILDLLVDNQIEVDIKWSTGSSQGPGHAWMIPTETFGYMVLLVTAWDTPAGSFFDAGLLRVKADGSNLGKPNKDQKRGVPKKVRENEVWWLHRSQRMPGNLLLAMAEEERVAVLAAAPGAMRIAEALKYVPGSVEESQIRLLDVPNPRRRLDEVNELLSPLGKQVMVDCNDTWRVMPLGR